MTPAERQEIILAIHGTSLDALAAAWVFYRCAKSNQIPVEFADRIDDDSSSVAGRHVFLIGAGLSRPVVDGIAACADDVVVFDSGPTALAEMRGAKLLQPFLTWQRERLGGGYNFSRIVHGDRAKALNVAAEVDDKRTTAGVVFDFFFPAMPRPAILDRVATSRAMDIPVLLAFMQEPSPDFSTWDRLAGACERATPYRIH